MWCDVIWRDEIWYNVTGCDDQKDEETNQDIGEYSSPENVKSSYIRRKIKWIGLNSNYETEKRREEKWREEKRRGDKRREVKWRFSALHCTAQHYITLHRSALHFSNLVHELQFLLLLVVGGGDALHLRLHEMFFFGILVGIKRLHGINRIESSVNGEVCPRSVRL